MKILLFITLALVGTAFAVELLSKDGDYQRIHGGHYAAAGQFPWNAAVHNRSQFLCSASLIRDQYLLTTAECIRDYPTNHPTRISVLLGNLKPNLGTSYGIVSIASHPEYTDMSQSLKDSRIELYHSHNIAILKSFFIISESLVAPINLQRNNEPVADGTPVQLSGWGGLNAAIQPDLGFAYMTTKNVYTCIHEIGGNPSVEYFYNLCTPGFQPESGAYSGACHYDHGGGLIIDYNTSPILVGLVSYASCDSTLIRSTIYTSIVAHYEWIEETIKNM